MRKRGGIKATRHRLISLFLVICALVTASTVTLALQRYQQVSQLEQSDSFLALASSVDASLHKKEITSLTTKAAAQQNAAKKKAEAAKIAAEAARNAGIVDSSDCSNASSHNDPSRIDVLVNKKHCLQPVMFEPADLQALASAPGYLMKREAALAFNQMAAAASASGNTIGVTSSYRSYSDQVSTYNYWVGVSGRDGADTYSARPGYSEHQTGLAVDVEGSGLVLSEFGGSSQYKWLQKNAAKYGFIQRYYKGYEAITGYSAEEWHYRYVGISVAQDMKAKGIKTLEQYWGMSGGDY